MRAPRPRIRLLVCGSAERGDDGAALIATAALLSELPEELRLILEVRRCGQLDVEDLLDIPPHEAAVIVDAAVGIEPGEIAVLPLANVADDGSQPVPRSSHALAIGQALALAAALGRPARGTFVGIGGRRFGYGTSLSRSVRAALPAYRAAIATELERLSQIATAEQEQPSQRR